MVKRTVAFCTGTRAEYGLLKPLIDRVRQDGNLEFELYVTGMHLSHEFGHTLDEILKDGVQVSEQIEILLSSDSPTAVIKSMGLALIGFGDIFMRRRPDVLVILGDRFEAFCAAAAATVAGIPIAHIHGGELSEGSIDDAFRHSITKMSTLHFASAEEYRQRIIRMGEEPSRVFNVGALGIENIRNLPLMDKAELEASLARRLCSKLALVTFHPATADSEPTALQFKNILEALDATPALYLIFTKANADADGRIINEMIDRYVEKNSSRSIAYASMGQIKYLSAMRISELVIGNSSSGIIEAPSFHIPTVNIGTRQRGRIKAASVIDCDTDKESIRAAIEKGLSESFRSKLLELKNPYEGEKVSEAIFMLLKKSLPTLAVNKSFYEGNQL
jgi:GDP/UDP-N,N'-diacetylbacillosamine 2-epimerase (hydrolysing)